MNKIISELYDKIDAQDKIINEQALEIARLKQALLDIKEYIEDKGISYLNIANQRTWCGKHSCENILDIVNKALGDKE